MIKKFLKYGLFALGLYMLFFYPHESAAMVHNAAVWIGGKADSAVTFLHGLG